MTAWCMIMKHHNWSIHEQAKFLKQIGELLARGYPIAEAIESISLQLPKKRKEELKNCLVDLKNGMSFHDGLNHLGFHKDLIGYVYFAEQHGSFADAILEGSNLALVKENDRKKLIKLLQYPVLLIVITGGLFVFLQKSLLPKFTSLFDSMSLEANIFMKILYSIDEYFPIVFTGFLLLFAIGQSIIFLYFEKSPSCSKGLSSYEYPLQGKSLNCCLPTIFLFN
jgi:competence protein ComGB